MQMRRRLSGGTCNRSCDGAYGVCWKGPGITAGKAAGIPTVGITTSQTPERLEAAGAVTTISDYRQLLRLVKGDTHCPA